jgi:hypothetical protein
MRRVRAGLVFFGSMCVFAVSALGCNLLGADIATGTPSLTAPSTNTPGSLTQSDSQPTISIESPPAGAQSVAGQRILVKILATDEVGITRVEMRESGRVVGVQSAPASARTFEALLPFTPTSAGVVRLEVVAYRRAVASEPAQVEVEVVRTERELRNPSSLDATAGVASGAAICTVQVTVTQLNMRRGPGTSFDILARLAFEESLTVVGRNAERSWFLVRRSSLQEGWVSADYVLTNGDCSGAPVVTPVAP